MKKLLIGLLALGNLSVFACDSIINSLSFASSKGMVVKFKTVNHSGMELGNPYLVKAVKGVPGVYELKMLSSHTYGREADIVANTLQEDNSVKEQDYLFVQLLSKTHLYVLSIGNECAIKYSHSSSHYVSGDTKFLVDSVVDFGSILGGKHYFSLNDQTRDRYDFMEVIGVVR